MKDKYFNKNIIKKSNNTCQLRVLYKKTGQVPEVKIIHNIFKLKKAIIKRNLDIIPYETVYIICNNRKKQNKIIAPNIILDFYHVSGDLILVAIDKSEREFKGLSQDDIIWYTKDLINKASNTTLISTKTTSLRNFKEFYERNFERDMDISSKSTSFEKNLIDVLTNIELVLTTLLNNQNKK